MADPAGRRAGPVVLVPDGAGMGEGTTHRDPGPAGRRVGADQNDQPRSSANFQLNTIAVTAPEPTAATSTAAAAISRAVFNRGSSGSPTARAKVSTALCTNSAIKTRQAPITSKHQPH